MTDRFGAGAVKLELRSLLDEIREQIRAGNSQSPQIESIAQQLEHRLIRLCNPFGRRAINATGILLHTGLGRAPFSKDTADALAACDHYSVLQASLDTGDRSLREQKIQKFLIELVGCEAVTVVNNNAAATMLILHTIASGREVIISRGQLIEIGGSFRMPDVMAQSGAILREVGTTNRTHLRDYEAAISEKTGAILRVHTSNYRIRGFEGTPDVRELVELGKRRGVPVIDDLGSGAIVPLKEFGISDEPLVADSIAAGTDVACFSGDKLICGPQAGIICGKKPIIERIRKSPFARMFRVCKLTLAGLETTLLHFLNGTYRQQIPFYRMLARPIPELERDAKRLCDLLKNIPGISASVAEDVSYVGSGSIPDEGIVTCVVRVSVSGISPENLARRLRMGLPSVFGRVSGGAVALDVRTLLEGEIELLGEAVKRACASNDSEPVHG